MTVSISRVIPVALLISALVGCAGGPPADTSGLKSQNSDVRRERVIQLGQSQPATNAAKKDLVSALTTIGQSDKDPLVRSAALVSLEKQDRSAAEALALQLAIDTDPIVRADAVKVLSHGNSPADRAALLYAVRNDKSDDVRREAVRGLAKFNDDEVATLLVALLGDDDRGIVVAAYRSLQAISGKNLGARPAQWKEWLDARTSVPPPAADNSTPAQSASTPVAPAAPVAENPAPSAPAPAPVAPVVEKPAVAESAPAPAPAPEPTPAPAPVPFKSSVVAPVPAPASVTETPAVAPANPTQPPSIDDLKRFRR